jgi:hypothetical protein
MQPLLNVNLPDHKVRRRALGNNGIADFTGDCSRFAAYKKFVFLPEAMKAKATG